MMNVDNFKSTLQEILNSNVANIKLYATTKQNETKKISISSDVSDNLLELFKKSIEDMFLDQDKEYRLKSIDDNNDEAAKTYYYFNGENTYERLNVLHNLSSLDEEVFNFENTNLDDIETFYITISNGEMICFTDQKHLTSDVWEIRLIEECEMPANMMNRKYKILPHLFLSEYAWSMYADANISILGNPMDLANKYLSMYDMAVPKHFARDCVYNEAKECVILGKTKYDETKKQMSTYEKDGFPKNFGLGENNILFRKHNSEKVIKLMNDWWNELNTQTKRDQLSLAYVVWKNGEKFFFMDESARGNEYFNIKLHNAHVVKNCNFYNFLLEKFDNAPKMYKYCLYCLVLVKKICKVINR
ncbi:MAG: DUF616 domain-containing protein [Erysipelotrichia bacterium]|nr:DUF616 domain-containing protein [Erysipelotrichia bacterium]